MGQSQLAKGIELLDFGTRTIMVGPQQSRAENKLTNVLIGKVNASVKVI